MEREERIKQIHKYTENLKEIHTLSTPDLSQVNEPDDYCKILVENFSKIGKLAAENRSLIDSVAPIVNPGDTSSDSIREAATQFIDLLVQEGSFNKVDSHMAELLDGLLEQHSPVDDSDINAKVISMAKRVKRDYFIVSTSSQYINDDTDRVRSEAIRNIRELETYLEENKFLSLSDKAKEYVLQYWIMGVLLFENALYPMPHEWWSEAIAMLDKANAILDNSLYKDALPKYDWEAYEFKICYYGAFLAYSYIPKDVAGCIIPFAEKGIKILKSTANKEILSLTNLEQMEDLKNTAEIIAGVKLARAKCDDLYAQYINRDKKDYTEAGLNTNLDIPALYFNIMKVSGIDFTESDYDRYFDIERSALNYIYNLPKQGDIYLKCATLLTNYPIFFKEVPGAMSMEDFCLSAFAAIHPPTYVHCNMVARFAECMAKHLIDLAPELFIGFPNCKSKEDVIANRNRILYYTYHSALCHDIGKLFIIDTITMYGRQLFDNELMKIKSHPDIGARIASEHTSTRDYVDVIRGHHIWFDGSAGYPVDFDLKASPYKTVIALVTAADGLDAATDTIGRSYNKGKTFSEYEAEVAKESGTRYAPYLPELFKQPEFRKDIEYLLTEGRKKQYRKAFKILKNNMED